MRLGLSLVLTLWGAAAGGAHALPSEAQLAGLRAAAFAPSTPDRATTPVANRASADGVTWLSTTRGIVLEPAKHRLDIATTSERVSAGAVLGPPGPDNLQLRGYDLSFTRGWPSAFSIAAGKYGLDLSPHASVGVGGSGRSAEAGAMVRFGKNLQEGVLNRLNVQDGASTFGGQARWYLFAAASGRAVGMNLTSRNGDWRRAGLSEDSANALIGDAQAGVGWRKGPMTASVGYVRREVKIRQGLEGLMGAGDRGDNLVALTFGIKPQR